MRSRKVVQVELIYVLLTKTGRQVQSVSIRHLVGVPIGMVQQPRAGHFSFVCWSGSQVYTTRQHQSLTGLILPNQEGVPWQIQKNTEGCLAPLDSSVADCLYYTKCH